eukprot:gene310-biopygen273
MDPTSATPQPRKQGFRQDVQGLRAVAVLTVLAAHAGVAFLPGGYVGVDVFFVISGFLITQLLVTEASRSGRVSLSGFYARRARRILPAASVVLVATASGSGCRSERLVVAPKSVAGGFDSPIRDLSQTVPTVSPVHLVNTDTL